MAKFFKTGNTFKVAPGDSVDIRDELPAGNYVLKVNPMTGFFLEIADSFQMPSKIYGDCLKNCDRILNTFRSRDGNTGVMLVGEKGSGKTLLARQVAMTSAMPTIIINTDFSGDEFNSFLSSITQPTIILFDEFEKVYSVKDQEKILTLLDGTYQSKKLFLMTSNSKWSLDTNLKNRPGRIFYLLEFEGLGEEFIRQFCLDRLEDKSRVDEVVKISTLFDEFNFDMLNSFVEEINRYGDDASELVRILNAKPEYSGRTPYVASVMIGNYTVPPAAISDRDIFINPTTDDFAVHINFCWKKDKQNPVFERISSEIGSGDADSSTLSEWLDQGFIQMGKGSSELPSSDYIYVNCSPECITQYETAGGMTYVTDGGFKVTLSKVSTSSKKKRAERAKRERRND